ncbi:hypothetical protein [Deinococcus hopiensis]|uniref:Uncharacterized protein n=1 Tax=Deinococcus hopiensis KR-140 TaxID=695939 RepID=A0A1W1VPC9_9DEIO|nr:hypothetical protein [Deinococcus hopiensis]SMB94921.1 hypothetical protein SAMN00790413_02599 [Deinococcus hopiensis KR-140]
MQRCALPVVLGPFLLAACAPGPARVESATATSAPVVAASTLEAAFSPEGVAWVEGGQACVARVPSYRPVCPKLPGRAVGVAWNGGDAWTALPNVGLLITLDRAARTVAAGRVVALSATRAYREDGSAVTYSGAAAQGVAGAPAAALTGGNGQDYVLLAGALRRVEDGQILETRAGPRLEETPGGVRSTTLPQVTALSGTYRLTGTALQRLDAAGRVVADVPHEPGRVGLIGPDVVTVTSGGTVRAFGLDLRPLSP